MDPSQQQKARTPTRTGGLREEPRERTQKAGAQDMTRCIESCLEVVRAASQCATHCIANDEDGERQEMILLCLDTADLAGATAKIAARDPAHLPVVARACAELSALCAEMCEETADHQVMEDCAELCRRCSDACSAVA